MHALSVSLRRMTIARAALLCISSRKKPRVRYAHVIYAEAAVLTRAMCSSMDSMIMIVYRKWIFAYRCPANKVEGPSKRKLAFFSLSNALQSLSFCKRKVEDGRLNGEILSMEPQPYTTPQKLANSPEPRSSFLRNKRKKTVLSFVMNNVIGLSA